MFIAFMISMLITIVGMVMINFRGRYDTIWGVLLFGGAAATALIVLISVVSFLWFLVGLLF